MTSSSRTLLQLLLPVALSACVAAPSVEPETVAVKASKLTPEYSSFNARVLSDAGNVEHSFSASLDRNVEPLTRLESAYTQQIGADSAQRIRVGDTISTAGMWGSSVRYGGMQFGTRTSPRADVIDAPRGRECRARGIADGRGRVVHIARRAQHDARRTGRRHDRHTDDRCRRDSSPKAARISRWASARCAATTR